MNVGPFLRNALRKLPVFGGLADARWRDHREAFKEVGINVFFSTAPIWLGCIFLIGARGFTSAGDVLYKNVEHGEMFIFATAAVAPLYYFIFKEYAGPEKFPNALGFIIVSAAVLLVSACGFAITRLLTVIGINSTLNEDVLYRLSWLLYAIAVLVVYLAHVYRNWRETGGASVFSTQTQEMVNAFNQEARS